MHSDFLSGVYCASEMEDWNSGPKSANIVTDALKKFMFSEPKINFKDLFRNLVIIVGWDEKNPYCVTAWGGGCRRRKRLCGTEDVGYSRGSVGCQGRDPVPLHGLARPRNSWWHRGHTGDDSQDAGDTHTRQRICSCCRALQVDTQKLAPFSIHKDKI